MSRTLFKSHRTMGFELARTRTPDNREYVILETAPHKEEAALAHTLRPVSQDEIMMEARVMLIEALDRIRFLGLDHETISTLFSEEISRSD